MFWLHILLDDKNKADCWISLPFSRRGSSQIHAILFLAMNISMLRRYF